jgi:sugar phosphate permease
VADRFGSRWLSPIGLAIACCGLVLLSQINAQSSMLDIIWRLVVAGIGQGLFQSPNTRTMMGVAPSNAQGEASGLLATGRVIGQGVGVAIMGTIFAGLGGALAGNILSAQSHNLTPASILTLQNMFVNGFHAALLNCALLAAIGIFTALARGQGAGSNQGR